MPRTVPNTRSSHNAEPQEISAISLSGSPTATSGPVAARSRGMGHHGAVEHHERQRRAATFDRVAQQYRRARPHHPAPLLDELVGITGVRPGDRVLDVGCGPGTASVPLAERGFTVVGLDAGARLASVAAAALARSPNVEARVVVGSLEHAPLRRRSFDLVVAATAWHWFDPTTRLDVVHDLLVAGGHVAMWDVLHVQPDDGDPIFDELQEVYDEIGESRPPGERTPRPGELHTKTEEMEAHHGFEVVHVAHHDWEVDYDAEGYIDLLGTFSGHLTMSDDARERLFDAVRARLALRPDGLLRRHWGAVLRIGRAT